MVNVDPRARVEELRFLLPAALSSSGPVEAGNGKTGPQLEGASESGLAAAMAADRRVWAQGLEPGVGW